MEKRENFFGSDNESFEDDKLFDLFNGKNCRSLVGKPKVFFLQKCEGKERDLGVTLHGSSKANGTKIPTKADFLYHYATFPGHVAYRTSDGSWFVESLCYLLKKYWKKKDLLQILTLVNDKVATEYETCNEEKQMPCIVSTLRKSLYLY
ncbi:caspase-3-like isoform X1 [Eleutherodactylus coqui]|uniref:caspase-3-like isoform X1 n=1 Tax=Eleutherodactylus coqui TaxID=57060 RepID=UPI0034627B1C